MDFAQSDIQTMLLDSAQRLLAATAGVEYWRAQRHQPLGFDEARWAQFAELGWLALPVPEAAGGLGGSLEDVALLNVALGEALATEPYVSTAVLADHLLKQAADRAQGRYLLGEIATGALRVALAHQEVAHQEADGGTLARRDGTGFVLQGAKLLALDAPAAGLLIVSAPIAGEAGLALFLVPADAVGLALEAYPLIDGTRAADLRLEGVALPASALLVGPEHGEAVLAEAIDRASVALMAQAVGAMEAAVQICGRYATERRQFGVAIGSFQAIQHMLADMFVAAHQARSMLYHALAHAEDEAGARGAAIAAARIVVGEAGQLVSRQGIQLHGGYGLTDEYAISHYFRRLMCLEKLYGDLACHVERFGAAVLG
nr:acyl-CoA dehydrogenase family protein [Novosphingobium sp.]HZV08633.1 acyl-CoA dehydrogenase family protein [Novosphingobium sp.]